MAYVVVALLFVLVVPALWMWLEYRRLWSNWPQPERKPAGKRPRLADLPDNALSVCWVGHSTLVIRWADVVIVTDPVLSDRIGVRVAGLWTVGPRRHTAPALTIEDLTGKVDLILLSHAHMDHVDLPTLRALAGRNTVVITAVGTGRLFKRMPFERVTELGGQDTVEVKGLRIHAVPVRHWGARYPWNHSYGWTGYLVEDERWRLFYAGDTAYTPEFRALQNQGEIDIACLPIGAYAPESFLRSHCTPEQAWQMFVDSGARHLVPIHWNTFVLSQEPVAEPMQRLLKAAGVSADRIVVREHGDVFSIPVRSRRRSTQVEPHGT